MIDMNDRDLRKNGEGYSDPTAYEAIKKVDVELDKARDDEDRFHKLLNMIFNMCELADFHIEERIIIKDKRTGKVWR